MLKHICNLEVKVGDRMYQFICDKESPLAEVHEALAEMQGFVVQTIQNIEALQQPSEENENGE